MNKKKIIFRLIENYINDFRGEDVQSIYGKGSYIKIHSMSQALTSNEILFEVVIVLGDTITEERLDGSLADVLVEDALVYFFPDQKIKTYVRWDV